MDLCKLLAFQMCELNKKNTLFLSEFLHKVSHLHSFFNDLFVPFESFLPKYTVAL